MSTLSHGTVGLVDDEPSIRETVGLALKRSGFKVDCYSDGQDAWEVFEHRLPDVAILDILMPRMDGLELCRRLRQKSDRLPILFLTSKDDELDKVLGLELGADDYLVKPFSMRELEARVRVMFRRLSLADTPTEPERMIEVDDLALDLDRYTVHWRDHSVSLTVTEFLMLLAMARRPGHVKSREQLMREGYPYDVYVSERTIDSHIKRIRRKFAQVAPDFDCIETVHGLGYRFREA